MMRVCPMVLAAAAWGSACAEVADRRTREAVRPQTVPNDPVLQHMLEGYYRHSAKTLPCTVAECQKPGKKYERLLPTQGGVQWMDHGGYCGAWSIQRLALAKGAWISQQQVRNHAAPGGGHDEEILATNIDGALASLKLKAEGFAYRDLPTPQADAYRGWIKQKLAAGHGVAWMIMLRGGTFPVYPGLEPYGQYSHVEPVVGILSDRPLNDTQWYDDDYLVHYTDADEHTYYRSMTSLPDDTTMEGNCAHTDYAGYPCIYYKYGFGWAIEDLNDPRPGLPASLFVKPWRSEPETRDGKAPEPLSGTLTVSGLTQGASYAVYRWDSVDDAFDYSKATRVRRFTAAGESEVYADPVPISSGGTTYYRCVEESLEAITV